MEKKTSILSLYALNLLVFISFALSIFFMDAELKAWYVFLVLLVMSGFETLFFYRKSNKSFAPLSNKAVIGVILKASGITVLSIGSILLVFILLIK